MTQTANVPPHREEAVTDHPLWCDPGSCNVTNNGGRHQSPQVELQAIEPTPLSVAVRLSQPAPMAGHPLADIPLVYAALRADEGDLFDVPMYPHMARELARILTHTANLTGQ